jgi:hypothetical protein
MAPGPTYHPPSAFPVWNPPNHAVVPIAPPGSAAYESRPSAPTSSVCHTRGLPSSSSPLCGAPSRRTPPLFFSNASLAIKGRCPSPHGEPSSFSPFRFSAHASSSAMGALHRARTELRRRLRPPPRRATRLVGPHHRGLAQLLALILATPSPLIAPPRHHRRATMAAPLHQL